MFCEKCGTQNADGGMFCSKCGKPIGAAAEDTRPAADNSVNYTAAGNAQKPQKKKSYIKRNLIIACLVLLLLAGGAVAAGFVWTIPGWTWMNTGTRLADKQLTLGEKYLSESKYEEAVLAFEKVIKIDAKNKDAYLGLADAYVGLENLDKAEETLEDGIDKLPEEEDLYIKLSDVYVDNKNNESAISILNTGYSITNSENIKQKTEKQCIKLADIYADNEDYDTAIDLLENGYAIMKSEKIKAKIDELTLKKAEKNAAAPAGTVAIAKDRIKIGVLHITSIDETSGYTFAHHKGILEMKSALGLSDAQVIEKDKVNDNDMVAIKNAIQELIDADCNVIFATSFNYMNMMEEFANDAKYQDIIFSHCSGYKSNTTNLNNYFGRIYESFYLAGIAAGMKAKQLNTPLLGFVSPMDVNMSEVTGGINAWALGVQSVYPGAVVKVKVTGSWYNPSAEEQAAQELLHAGCAVIGQYCDSDTAQTTAQNAGKFGCGYNSDMTPFAPQAHLCAPIWNWGVYYTQAVQKAIEGKWTPANYYEGMNTGLVGISPVNEAIAAPGTKAAVDAAKAKITDGSLFVFSGPLSDNKGNQIIRAGERLTDAQIMGGINYYIKGVELL